MMQRDAFGLPKPEPTAETDPLPLVIRGQVYPIRHPDRSTVNRCRQWWRAAELRQDRAGGRVETTIATRDVERLVPRLLGDNLMAMQVMEMPDERILWVARTVLVWVCLGREAALHWWQTTARLGAHGRGVPPAPPLAGEPA